MANGNLETKTPREVLVNLGNRWVVFSAPALLPADRKFRPSDVKPLKRVADESEVAHERILKTLRVSDAHVEPAPNDAVDFMLVSPNSGPVLVELKVRQHEPKASDIDAVFDRFRKASDLNNADLEVWIFSLERLILHIYSKRGANVEHTEFAPTNVWEFGAQGQPFERARVVERVADWVRRIDGLYKEVEGWVLNAPGLQAVRERSVDMAEEMMRSFAVPPRELPVLDVNRNAEPVLSFIPRGLWVLGANGRIDIITRTSTRILFDQGSKNLVDWQLVSAEDIRSHEPFDQEAFAKLIGDA